MAGTTYSKFFWQDWQGDLELKVCSMAAQGWWMRLLCVAGAANDRGRVTIAGRKPTPDEMRRASGCLEVTDEEVSGWEAELLHHKVCDQDPDGVLVSRRQRRASSKSHPQSVGGHARAKSARREGGKFAPADHQRAHQQETPAGASNAGGGSSFENNNIPPANQHASPGTINHQPSTINHQPQKSSVDSNSKKIDRLSAAFGFRLDDDASRGPRLFGEAIRLEMEGFDLELDILPTIDDSRKESGSLQHVNSMKYFRKPLEARREARLLLEGIAKNRAAEVAALAASISRPEWNTILNKFLRTGLWLALKHGPSPVEFGCLAPPDMLVVAQKHWDAEGQHPREDYQTDGAWMAGSYMFPKAVPFWSAEVVSMARRA